MSGQCFISHASEDKEAFVRPLAHELKKLGVNVWYDEFSLKLGDSLRRSIDKGLVECDVGIVVLSHSFFSKEWPQRELDALITSEISGSKRIFPIWHGIDAKYLGAISALLADRVALKSDVGVAQIAQQLANLLPPWAAVTGEFLANRLERFLSRETYVLEYLCTECKARFLQLQAFHTEYQAIQDSYFPLLTDDQIDEQQYEIERKLEPHKRQLAATYDLPKEIEIIPDEPIPEERLGAWFEGFEQWVSGTLGTDETNSLILDIEIYLEVDDLYILLGLPNYSVSNAQRELLSEAIVIIGSWYETSDEVALLAVCQALRDLRKQ